MKVGNCRRFHTRGLEYSAALELYDKLVATNAKVERRGATVPYTTLNGHMSGEIEGFLKKYKTKLCEQYGVVQKEYVIVPSWLLKKTSKRAKG